MKDRDLAAASETSTNPSRSPNTDHSPGLSLTSVLESLVIAAILLVLAQTFLEDFAVVSGWPVELRSRILLAGFFFDLFFTVEFLVRLFYAIMNRKAVRYLTLERGWIDFLASIPLLMFNSGPAAAAMITGHGIVIGAGGILNLLKVIKAIRIARILRFLRIIKIFRGIKNIWSPMAQRHVASVTTISVTVVVFSLLFFTVASGGLHFNGLEEAFTEEQRKTAAYLVDNKDDPSQLATALKILEAVDTSLLVVRHRGQLLFTRYSDGYYRETFTYGDYSYLQRDELELFFDQRPLVRQLSRQSLLFFFIVVLVVLAYLLIYSPHFALTVSDPIHVMRRGLEEADYNLEAKVPEKYADDDVFRLAAAYNEKFLTLKDRTQSEEGQSLLGVEEVSSALKAEES